jgi:3-hydroxybutyrate dehydrogenase
MQRLARPLTLTVLDLNGDAAKDVTEKIGDEALQADLSDYQVLDSLRVKADVVVTNAGLQRVARIEDFPPERFSVMLRLMLKAPFRIVRAALPGRYEKGWGRVDQRLPPCTACGFRRTRRLTWLSSTAWKASRRSSLEGGPHGVT